MLKDETWARHNPTAGAQVVAGVRVRPQVSNSNIDGPNTLTACTLDLLERIHNSISKNNRKPLISKRDPLLFLLTTSKLKIFAPLNAFQKFSRASAAKPHSEIIYVAIPKVAN